MSEQIYTNKVSIVHFHIFMSFYSIYAILLRIRFCRDLRFFCVNFWGQKLRLRKFFDKYDVCLLIGAAVSCAGQVRAVGQSRLSIYNWFLVTDLQCIGIQCIMHWSKSWSNGNLFFSVYSTIEQTYFTCIFLKLWNMTNFNEMRRCNMLLPKLVPSKLLRNQFVQSEAWGGGAGWCLVLEEEWSNTNRCERERGGREGQLAYCNL